MGMDEINNTSERYFIVSFRYVKNNGAQGHGDASLKSDDGFLKREQVVRELTTDIGDIYANITILNIIELSKSDYLDWKSDGK